MKISEYVSKKEFPSKGSGLAEGKTLIDLQEAEIEEKTEPDGRTSYLATVQGKKIFLPITVMKEIQRLSKEGKTKVEVIRSGKEKNDTKYIVLGV